MWIKIRAFSLRECVNALVSTALVCLSSALLRCWCFSEWWGGGDYNPQKLMTMCLPQRIYSAQMPRKLASKWFSWQSNIISDCKGPTYLCLQLKRGKREREGEENEQHTSKNPRERKPLYKVERNAMWRILAQLQKQKRERERERERETSDFRHGPTAETTDGDIVGCHRNGDRRLCVNCLHIDWNECVRLDCSGIISYK